MNLEVSSPLAGYAAKYWIIHAQAGGKNDSQLSLLLGLIMKLLTEENIAFGNWVQLCNIDDNDYITSGKQQDIAKPLYYASLAGLTEATYALLERGTDVNAEKGRYGNALQGAASKGHFTIAKLLIKKGADVNTQGGRYGNALQAAALRGHEAIVKLLIEKGADVNAQGGRYGNALQAASYGGHEAIVMLLIEKGADINLQGG